MKEDIISFPQDGERQPFQIVMCGISYCDGSYRIDRKNSGISCIEYIIQGTGTVQTEDTVFHPSRGDIYLLHEGKDHVYFSDSKDPWIKIWMNITGPLVDKLLRTYGIAYVNHVQGVNALPLFRQFYHTAEHKEFPRQQIFHQNALLFHQIVQEISEGIHGKDDPASKEAALLKSYLDEQIERSVSIEELAGLIYRSPSQTIRIFKTAFGTSPYRYLLEQKISMAKLLLRNTAMPVKEISFRVGFSDEHYFSGYFKSVVGISPNGYRKGQK